MQLHTREHAELVEQFKRIYKHLPLQHEAKEMWAKGYVFANGVTNDAFLAFRHGYAFAKALHQ